MTEEEILRKKLDRLNENSHYGIMIDTEITKIVRSHIKRLEEATMHPDCEFCMKRDICTRDVPKPCNYRYTEEEHIADQMSTKGVLPDMYLPKTYRKKKEDKEMKATSTQTIKNVKDISVTIENYPVEMESKITIVASTDDDIFEFEFEGPDLLQSCKKAGLLNGWEKDLKIKELREMNDDLEQEREAILEANDKLREEFDKVAEENKKLRNRINNLKRPKTPTFADKEPTSRRDILKAAEMCVCGQREQDYGTPESNFQLIADLWNDYLFNSSKNDITITPTDVAMMMALMKIARIRNGGGSGDSFIDLAGYAACGGEIWYGGKKSIPEGE